MVRLGLIAMSGLRICDEDLLQLGFSFPGLRRRAEQIESLPSLGLLTIAGQVPESWEIEYHEVRDLSEMNCLARFDVVFLSFLTATAKEAYRWADQFREVGTKVILGGLHVTLCPAKATQHGDAIVIGEGEPVMPALIADLEAGKLQTVYRSTEAAPLDWSNPPLPRFDLVNPRRYDRFTVQTQRGCPWSCSFCASSIRLGGGYRVKAVEAVVREVRAIKSQVASAFIEFADDNTFTNRAHSRDLMKALAEENIPWFTESDVSVAEDAELLQMIKDAGCRQILIGLEAPDRVALEGVEQRRNWKAHQADHYLRAIECIQGAGITVNGCFVLGLDGQDASSFDAVFDFVERSGLYDVQITYITPFPGTPLYQKLSEEGRLLVQDATERGTLFDINVVPERLSVDELREGFHQLMARLYDSGEVRRRRRRFFQQWKTRS